MCWRWVVVWWKPKASAITASNDPMPRWWTATCRPVSAPMADQFVQDVLDPVLQGHQSSPRSTARPVSASKGTDACS